MLSDLSFAGRTVMTALVGLGGTFLVLTLIYLAVRLIRRYTQDAQETSQDTNTSEKQ